MRAHRVERTRLDALVDLPTGGVRVDARPTRAGVLTYTTEDGQTIREWRPQDEVFAPASLATLRGVAVTDGHPAEGLVSAASWGRFAKGHAGDDVRADGDLVAASLVVSDAAAVDRVKRGELVELSCGYACDVDETPGVTPEGERYDRVQRAITYNHVALLPPAEGRAGPACALRLDGHAVPVNVSVRRDAASPATPKGQPMKIKIGGREYRCDDAAEMAAAQGAVGEAEKKRDADTSAIDALQAALTDALGKLAMMKAQLEAEEAKEGEAPPLDADNPPPEVMDSWDHVRATARKHGIDPKGQKLAALKAAVVAKVMGPETKLDSLDAKTVDGMFRAVAKVSADRNDSLARVNELVGAGAVEARTDAAEPDADAARAAWRTKAINAWKPARAAKGAE